MPRSAGKFNDLKVLGSNPVPYRKHCTWQGEHIEDSDLQTLRMKLLFLKIYC